MDVRPGPSVLRGDGLKEAVEIVLPVADRGEDVSGPHAPEGPPVTA
jgi:hypothetical protein